MSRAYPKLEPIPEKLNPLVCWLVERSLPLLLRFRLRRWLPAGIARVETKNVERLVELYRQFQAGQIRLLMAFRHSEVDDPLCMAYLLSRAVPQAARQQGVALKLPIYAHFLYDRGMPLWAGSWLGWLLSRLGGVAIHRGRSLDWTAIRTARTLLVSGRFPMAIAPEGATNGHGERIGPLEPGVAQLGLWCAEDLLKAKRRDRVIIVPIGIQYRYVKPPWVKLDRLLRQLETESDLSPPDRSEATTPDNYYPRLLRLGEHLLSAMEEFYRRFYHQNLPVLTPDSLDSDQPNALLSARLQRLLDTALKVSESYFDLPAKGTIVDRCRRLEEAGWRYIYRDDWQNRQEVSPLERGLGDWVAAEASLRMQHMRLVESFVAVTGTYICEKPTVERFAETTLLLFDVLARLKGEKYPSRPRLGWRWAQITVGEPICASDRLPDSGSSRRASRQAVADLTQELQVALEQMIVP